MAPAVSDDWPDVEEGLLWENALKYVDRVSEDDRLTVTLEAKQWETYNIITLV